MTSSVKPARSRTLRSVILPAIVAATVLVPNAIVIALGTEDFPFTTAPMFAHHVDPDSTLYAFRFEGVHDDVSEPLPVDQTNLGERELKRQFLSWYYRPMTQTSPFRDLSDQSATRDAFEARMAEFFRPIVEFLHDERGLDYERVDVFVDIVDARGDLIRSERVGRYEARTSEYIHEYEAAAR